MKWFWVWVSFAVLYAILFYGTHASGVDLLVSFVAWCGGVASALTYQEVKKRRRLTAQ